MDDERDEDVEDVSKDEQDPAVRQAEKILDDVMYEQSFAAREAVYYKTIRMGVFVPFAPNIAGSAAAAAARGETEDKWLRNTQRTVSIACATLAHVDDARPELIAKGLWPKEWLESDPGSSLEE